MFQRWIATLLLFLYPCLLVPEEAPCLSRESLHAALSPDYVPQEIGNFFEQYETIMRILQAIEAREYTDEQERYLQEFVIQLALLGAVEGVSEELRQDIALLREGGYLPCGWFSKPWKSIKRFVCKYVPYLIVGGVLIFCGVRLYQVEKSRQEQAHLCRNLKEEIVHHPLPKDLQAGKVTSFLLVEEALPAGERDQVLSEVIEEVAQTHPETGSDWASVGTATAAGSPGVALACYEQALDKMANMKEGYQKRWEIWGISLRSRRESNGQNLGGR